MPIVDVKGVGTVQFPDHMSPEQIQAVLRKKYPRSKVIPPLPEGFTLDTPQDLPPFQDVPPLPPGFTLDRNQGIDRDRSLQDRLAVERREGFAGN